MEDYVSTVLVLDPIPSMGLVYLPTFGCFLYHTVMVWGEK